MDFLPEDNIRAADDTYFDQLLQPGGVPRINPGESLADYKRRYSRYISSTFSDLREEQIDEIVNDEIKRIGEEISNLRVERLKRDADVRYHTFYNDGDKNQKKASKKDLDKKLTFDKFIGYMQERRYNIGKDARFFNYIQEAQHVADTYKMSSIDYEEFDAFMDKVVQESIKRKNSRNKLTEDDLLDLMGYFEIDGEVDVEGEYSYPLDDAYGSGRKRKLRMRTRTIKRRKNKKGKTRKNKKRIRPKK
jgi:hypothetical protein